ncbi:cysteine synthase A [Lactobacillus sp. S2-2]|uniref:cysteine synthase A n=1 Tax=Lactobacillus sp. S2-2 TaxID=2692917 RepID=UPI001F002E7D|nr:cysteine synthase A [Lactobacillus sp. S2-2]MCF6515307.1 cysteine synthase A [Lactobacillus sp. S2-2]
MSKIYNSISELIGNTPIIKLNEKLVPNDAADVYVKLEFFNPTGSIKDRIAESMIEEAEKHGKLKQGDTIIEPTSGNTGIGLASIGAEKGYHVIIVMPETMSIERRKIMQGYGAELILTPGNEGMSGSIKKAQELGQKPHTFIPMQFENIANPNTHAENTGKEIIETFGENNLPDAFVAGIGTGGTLSGVGKQLKQENENIKVYALEPEESPLLKTGQKGPHKIQGISAGFIPQTLNQQLYDDILEISSDEAIEMAQLTGKKMGFTPGISSGANIAGAIKLAKEMGSGKSIITVAPDYGDRYLSTDLYDFSN